MVYYCTILGTDLMYHTSSTTYARVVISFFPSGPVARTLDELEYCQKRELRSHDNLVFFASRPRLH